MKVAKFEEVIQGFLGQENVSKSLREQGFIFERLVKKILSIEPIFRNEFKEVYLWSEFNTKFGINSQDIGIDIMALTHNDEWISVQCKAYSPNHILSQSDLKNFLGINTIKGKEAFFEIKAKYIFHTCKVVSDNFNKAINQSETSDIKCKSYGFYDLLNFDIDWKNFSLEDFDSLQKLGQKELRPYQNEALSKTKKHFLQDLKERGKIIMACGTGKSLLAVRTIDALVENGEIAIFFAPSLALINQMLLEFFRESKSQNYKVLAVCSDVSIGKNINEDIKSNEIYVPVISKSHTLSARIKHYKNKGKVIIFSTYQSIDCVIDAQKDFKDEIKLIVNDEAHRTAGYEKIDIKTNEKSSSIWQKTHDNALLKAKFRLYLTATPRIYSEDAKEKTKKNDLMLYSMDDEDVFGEEIYTLKFDEAISKNILCDYRVLITFTNKDSTASLANAKGKAYKAEDLAKMIGLQKAILKQDLNLIDENGILQKFEEDGVAMKRIVAFHHSIKNSQFFKENFYAIDEKHIDENYTEHIDGTDNASTKAAKLSWLKTSDEKQFKILSNAKCLTEGIDVPNLDAVSFFDPRDSVVDIVQAVGRVMRKAENKKLGYIILPIALSNEDIKDYNKTMKSSAFKGIWKVLKALRSHDERLVDMARINEVVKIATPKKESTGGFSPNIEDKLKNKQEALQSSLFALGELAANIKNAIPKNLGDLTYWELYAKKVGSIMQDLSLRIKNLTENNKDIKALFDEFCVALKTNLNASFKEDDAIALIAQHIITKPIFAHIFPDLDFAKFDKVSNQLEKIHAKLLEFGLSQETQDLENFYLSVQNNAKYAKSEASKQDLIKNLYDSLFKSAFKKDQEKLGIVYTPIECVDFIIHSLAYVLKKHFAKDLSDENVHICDPFTGTGTFITRLIQSGYLDKNLEFKYKNELWANEITLLGYYIAQLNITASYHKQMQSLNLNPKGYNLLENLLFTDTFNTYIKGSLDLQSNYLEQNLKKIEDFKNADFKIIFGNPPYSAGQKNANDDNKNIEYDTLDSRIADTYISAYKVQKFKYDSFKRAIRYASDRIEKNGIVAFITNGSFIEGKSDAGLRACLEKEFDEIYIFNLRGNINKNMQDKESGEGENIFGNASKTPVAIIILIKDKKEKASNKAEFYYYDIGNDLSRDQKLNIITHFKSIENLPFAKITPNKDYDWINQRDYSYLEFVPIANKKLKEIPLSAIKSLKNKDKIDEEVFLKGYVDIFEMFSMGIVSNRDPWVYNFSKQDLEKNMSFMIENYNGEVVKKENNANYEPIMDKDKINWSRDLRKSFDKDLKFDFHKEGLIVECLYRPFTKCHLYLAKHFNEMLCQMPQIYPTTKAKNMNILDCEADFEAQAKQFFKAYKYLPNLTICIDEGGQGGGAFNKSNLRFAFLPSNPSFSTLLL